MAWRRQLKREFGLSGQRHQKKQCLGELARAGAGRSLRFEPLEDRRLLASDFGDAPAPFPTLLSDDGARHEAVGPRLGASRGSEVDGLPSSLADADLSDDGVAFGDVRAGQLGAVVTVDVQNAPGGAILDAWIDFNGNGSWVDPGERIANGVELSSGLHDLTFDVPVGISSIEVFARFRLSSEGGLAPSGAASDGEVEDVRLFIEGPTVTEQLYGSPNAIAAGLQGVTGLDTGDIDGDGDVDVVVATFGYRSISIAFNDGDGDFTFYRLPDLVYKAQEVSIADLDNDGDQDLLFASSETNTIGWLENDGAFQFTRRVLSASMQFAWDVLAVDVDSDGDLDVVGSSTSDRKIVWFENNGEQVFTEHALEHSLSHHSHLAAADMDSDGDIDLLVSSGSRIAWFENDGEGRLESRILFYDQGGLSPAVPVDIDGDGDLDIVAPDWWDRRIYVHKNLGGMSFGTPLIISGIGSPLDVAVVDYDGDGDLDILSADRGPSSGAVWAVENRGPRQFFGQRIQGSGSGLDHVAVADLDNDGALDILAAGKLLGASSDALFWQANAYAVEMQVDRENVHEDSAVAFSVQFSLSSPARIPVEISFDIGGTANLNDDYVLTGARVELGRGWVEVPAGERSVSITVSPIADSEFERYESVLLAVVDGTQYTLPEPQEVSLGLLNDDLGADFGDAPARYATLLQDQGAYHLGFQSDGPRLGSLVDYEVDGQPTHDASGDTGDDGVAIGPLTVGELSAAATVFSQDGRGRLDAWIDFNGNGSWVDPGERVAAGAVLEQGANVIRFDVPVWAVSGATFARFRVSSLGGLGPAGVAFDGEVEDYEVSIASPAVTGGAFNDSELDGVAGELLEVATGDFNGDLRVDLASITAAGDLVLYLRQSNGQYTASLVGAPSEAIKGLVVGDLDGDGDADLSATAAAGGAVLWYENLGGLDFLEHSVDVMAGDPSYLAIADLDGDGDSDIIADLDSGDGIVWLMNQGGGAFSEMPKLSSLGSNNGPFIVVDMDGDSDVDIVQANRRGQSSIFWLENDGAQGFESKRLSGGAHNSVASAVADIDRDGDLDVLQVAGTGAGVVWVENRGTTDFAHHTIFFESIEDFVLLDADGDGDLDLLATPTFGNSVIWLENDGAGGFTTNDTISVARGDRSLSVADLDGDSDLDVLISPSVDGSIGWLENSVEAVVAPVERLVPEGASTAHAFSIESPVPWETPFDLYFSVGGSATPGVDYSVVGATMITSTYGFVAIPAGAQSHAVQISPVDDSEFEVAESVILALQPGIGYGYLNGGQSTILIGNNDFGADLGDAPSPYPTMLEANGPVHFESIDGPYLGSGVTLEVDGAPSAASDGDADDGVTFGVMRPGQAGVGLDVVVGGADGVLDVWIDFNQDGSWSGEGERVLSSAEVFVGLNTLRYSVPAWALSGAAVARVRLSSAGVSAVTGPAADGEVEDYLVPITAPIENRGDFTLGSLPAAVPYTDSVASAAVDMDRDGDVDTVWALPGRQLVWSETLDIGLSVEWAIDTRTDSLSDFCALDLDADGDVDIVAWSYTGRQIVWYENDGQQRFTERPLAETISRPSEVQVADLDGDGMLDIVVAGSAQKIRWYKQQAGGSFVEQHLSHGFDSLREFTAVDLDRDGDIDVAAAYGEDLYWFENDGNGQFTRRLIVDEIGVASTIDAGDLDSDGDIDIIVGISSQYEVLWFENEGNARFENRHSLSTAVPYIPTSINLVDLSGNGHPDVLVEYVSGDLSWHEGDGNGGFVDRELLDRGTVVDAVPTDFDGDGDLDVLTGRYSESGPEWLKLAYEIVVDFPAIELFEASATALVIRVSTDRPVGTSLPIQFALLGSAQLRQDYELSGAANGVVIIPAGESAAEFVLNVVDDLHVEDDESVIVSIEDGPDYFVDSVAEAQFHLLSDDSLADFGDAPAPYRTLFADGGAQHSATSTPGDSPRLGAQVGRDPNGLPDSLAGAHSSDDGVVFGELRPGMQDASVTVTVGGAAGILDAWIDFNADGSWDGVGERVFSSVSVGEGVSELQFDVPSYVGTGPIYARFRLSSVGSPTPGGLAIDGEVEDYLVEVASPVETDGVFVPHTLFAASIVDPYSFEAGDIDGDGDIDIVVGLHGPSRIVWLENDGNQGFTERLVAFGASRVLALGDLDTDGDLDLVAADVTLDRVQWFENDGQGVFGAHLVVDGWGMSAAAIADMNVDGVLDIVLLSESDEQLSWFRRESDGAFSERHIAGDLGNAGRLTVADLDRDGDIDIVTAGNAGSSSPLSWHENQGIGLFATHVVDASWRSSVAARVIDFDLDGDHDIILSNRDHAIAWYENDGEQWFELRPEIVASSVRDAELGDFDGDGSIDVVSVGGFTYGRAYLFKRSGPNEFTQAWLSPNLGPHDASLTTDLDGDGDLDLVALSSNSDQLTWLENVVTASFEAGALPLLVSEGEVLPIAVSIDHERTVATKIRLGVEGAATEGDDYRFVGATRGEFGEWTLTIPAGALSASFSLVAVDDLLIEDDEELLVSIGAGHDYQVGMSNQWEIVLASDDSLADFGDAPSPYPTLLALGGAHHAPTRDGESGPRLGESLTLESDGAPSHTSDSDEDDGVVLDEYLIGQNNALLSVNVQGASGLLDAWIDFNRDGSWGGPGEQIFASLPVEEGESELAFSVPTWAASGTTVARFRVSTSGGLGYAGGAADGEVEDYSVTINPAPRATGEFADSQQILGGPVSSGYSRELVVGDIDADGDQDLVAWSQADGLLVLENLGGSVYETRSLGFNETLTELQIVDLDRNGFSELLVLRNGKLIWLSLQGEADVEPIDLSPEAYPAISAFAVADLNGDTRPDIIRTSNNGRILWLENLGQGEFASHLIENHAGSFNIEPHDVDAADFDRDGDIDIAIAGRDFFGETLVYVNNGAGLFTERRIAHDPARLVVFDDLDGDGHMDVLTSGGSTVNWFRMVDGVVGDEVVVGSSESTIKTIEVVDLDGDGDRDVITIPTWGSVSLFINEGDEFSRRELPETGILAAGAVMDVDGDQVLDLVISDVASEAIKVYRQPQVVRLTPSTSVVSESSAAPFVLRVFVDAPATESIDVPFLVAGTGTYGVDYRLDGAQVVDGSHGVAVIAAGQSYVDLRLIPIADELAELVETAFVSLVSEPNVSAGLYLLDDQLGGDYGDAPAPYPVDPVSGGAAHFAVGPYLGENRTAEVAGVNSIDADDDAGDDGVTLTNVIPGNASSVASIDLSNAPGGAFLDGWIDFDGDGSWGGHGEKVFDSVPIVEGVSSLTFTTPGWAKPGLTFARFRVSTTGGLGLKGGALDGEVEDFRIVVQTPATVPVGFTHSVIGSEGIQTLFPKAVDFDRDGDVDVIYATVDRQIVWLESIGARQFQERPISVADATIWDLEVADINGDGALDVLVATATLQSSTLMVLESGFEGDFSSRSIAEEFQDIGSIEVADIDGDGDSDLLVTGTPMRYGATDPQAVETVMWMENDGTGGLRYHKIDSLRVRPSDAAIADLDQDGILDFVVYGLYGDVVAWYRNDGKQQFVQQQVATSFSGPANAARYGSVTAADIDLDGDPDLLVSPGELGTPFAWYENNGEGAFIEKLVGHGLQGRTVEAVDVDGDGDLDAVYGGPGAFVWGENRVVGDYSGDHVVDQEDYIVWRSTYGQTGVNLGADGNRDGVIDAADYTIWRDAVSDAKPERTFVLHAVYPASIGGAAAADFDGDGDIDVIAGGGSGLVLFLNSAVVTVTSSGHIIDEAASGYVEVTVTRDRDWSAALEVGVDIKGVALSGVDYVLSGPISQSPGEAIVTIPAGEPSATFRVTAVDDALREFDEGIAITVQSGSNYVVQGPAEVRGVVVSDEVGGDFGDAPAPYRTLLADNGAFHTQGTAEDPRLGDSRGLQADASPSLDAGGDSSDDGVLSWELRVGETTASLTVDVQGSSGVLDVWIDLNQDGTWNGTWERVIASAPVSVGEHKLRFEIPSSALDGITYARLRISDAGVDGPDGFGGNGETEDYQVIVLPPVASSGHFSSRQPADVTGGGSAKHIAADLDRDGDTDFVILDSSNDRIVLAENTPNGFQATTLSSSYWNLVSLTVADIDGDGFGDIVAGFSDRQTVVWLRNNRDLSFGYRTHRVDGEPGHFGIVAGDLDGDGRQDLLSISGDYSSLVWHRNLPGGTFESTVVAVHPSGGLFLPSLVDIDGDGDLDVIIAHNVDDSGVSWYENNGSGVFTRRAVPAATHRPNSLQPIDFDRDGDQDLIAGLYQQGRVAWYENDGSEGFVERTLELAGASGYDVDAADFDGDGNLDLLASLNGGTAFNAVFLNNGAQEFSRQLLVSPTIDNHNSATDVDADGDLDVVSTRYNGQVFWFENQSIVDPVEQSPETDPAPSAAVNAPLTLADNGGLAESHLPLLSPTDHDAFGDDILLRGSFDAQPRLETAAVDKAFSYQSLASGTLPLVSDLGAEAETLEDSCADLCVEWDEFSDGDSVWTAQTREGGHWLRRRR